MDKRRIKERDELETVLRHFNSFHDGFLKSIRIISGSKFNQNLPWEKPKQYDSNEERLRDTSLSCSEKTGLFLEIHHYNYDWPNISPSNKIALYLQNVKDVDPNIVRMVGMPIYDCETVENKFGLSVVFTFESYANSKPKRIKLRALECEKISIHKNG